MTGPLAGHRVLLVDDNVGTATLFAGVLQDVGAVVEHSKSADAAMAQATRHSPSALVIHLPLPKDAAAALGRRIRRNRAVAETKIVILSGEESAPPEELEVADVVHPPPFSPQRVQQDVVRLVEVGTARVDGI